MVLKLNLWPGKRASQHLSFTFSHQWHDTVTKCVVYSVEYTDVCGLWSAHKSMKELEKREYLVGSTCEMRCQKKSWRLNAKVSSEKRTTKYWAQSRFFLVSLYIKYKQHLTFEFFFQAVNCSLLLLFPSVARSTCF